jgi:hypothetical protein
MYFMGLAVTIQKDIYLAGHAIIFRLEHTIYLFLAV